MAGIQTIIRAGSGAVAAETTGRLFRRNLPAERVLQRIGNGLGMIRSDIKAQIVEEADAGLVKIAVMLKTVSFGRDCRSQRPKESGRKMIRHSL